MTLLVFVLNCEVIASAQLRTKFDLFHTDNNTKEAKEGLCISGIHFRREGRLENKKSIS